MHSNIIQFATNIYTNYMAQTINDCLIKLLNRAKSVGIFEMDRRISCLLSISFLFSSHRFLCLSFSLNMHSFVCLKVFVYVFKLFLHCFESIEISNTLFVSKICGSFFPSTKQYHHTV